MTREEMTAEILACLESWTRDDLLQFAMCALGETLERLDDTELAREYELQCQPA